jgi:hypothetical protein
MKGLFGRIPRYAVRSSRRSRDQAQQPPMRSQSREQRQEVPHRPPTQTNRNERLRGKRPAGRCATKSWRTLAVPDRSDRTDFLDWGDAQQHARLYKSLRPNSRKIPWLMSPRWAIASRRPTISVQVKPPVRLLGNPGTHRGERGAPLDQARSRNRQTLSRRTAPGRSTHQSLQHSLVQRTDVAADPLSDGWKWGWSDC